MPLYRAPHDQFVCEVCGERASFLISFPQIDRPRPICTKEILKLNELEQVARNKEALGPHVNEEIEWQQR